MCDNKVYILIYFTYVKFKTCKSDVRFHKAHRGCGWWERVGLVEKVQGDIFCANRRDSFIERVLECYRGYMVLKMCQVIHLM